MFEKSNEHFFSCLIGNCVSFLRLLKFSHTTIVVRALQSRRRILIDILVHFLIYINDFPDLMPCSTIPFADDKTALYLTHPNPYTPLKKYIPQC